MDHTRVVVSSPRRSERSHRSAPLLAAHQTSYLPLRVPPVPRTQWKTSAQRNYGTCEDAWSLILKFAF
jgi:hypothetical protein